MRFAFYWLVGSLIFAFDLGGATSASAASSAAPSALEPLTVYTRQNVPPTPTLDQLPLQSSVSQYGIKWTFDRPTHVGHFINGDWYVVGPVTVVNIDPRPEYGREVPEDQVDRSGGDSKVPVERRVRNGSMLDMPPKQEVCWDSGQKGFFNYKLAAHLPIVMKPGDCLASSISYRIEDTEISNGRTENRRTFHDNCPARVVALLTCVEAPLPVDAFRPGYCDREQTIYLARNLKRGLLPDLPPYRVSWPPDVSDPLKLAVQFQKPWVNTGFFGFDEPMENMPHYGQQIGQAVSDAGLLLCTAVAPEAKERLLVNFVQVGIDYWSCIKNGHPGWSAWGGHGSGRKFTMVFAGTLLGNDRMANVSREFPDAHFGEDEQTAYGNCWSGATVVFTGHSGIDEATGIGRDYARGPQRWGPYEHLNPSRWDHEQWTSEAYRRANTSCCWVGEALVMRIMHLEKQWNHDAFFDYVDRWMNEDDVPLRAVEAKYAPIDLGRSDYSNPTKTWMFEGYAGYPFIKTMWDKYRSLSPALQDGWKQPQDDSYYLNAIALEKKRP